MRGQPVTRIDLTASAETRRQGFALCLSGGGYRAALFHLGILRRLNETGLLSRVTSISSASGGSILAAFLADRVRSWPNAGEVIPDWDERVAQPVKEFTAHDIRTGPLLRRLIPVNWFRTGTAVEALAHRYRAITRMPLPELPTRPEYIICATDMSFGANWEFSRHRMGDYQAGYTQPRLLVADAVAASSCFPPVFSPMKMHIPPENLKGGKFSTGSHRSRILRGLRLSDGGVYDNLALEPVWKRSRAVLVCDGGSTFGFEPDDGPVWRLRRYTGIINQQARALRVRWFHAQVGTSIPEGVYCGIGSRPTPGYSPELVDSIATIRTDLDRFSRAEQDILENHGYFVAEARVHNGLSSLAPRATPAVAPNPQWIDDDGAVRSALRNSSQRTLRRRRR